MKVLIIERSRLQQTVLSRTFSSKGFVVTVASSYRHALERIRKEDIDFVYTSFQLDNEKTGIDLTKAIRSIRKYRDIPIMLKSSPDKSFSTQFAYNAGVTEICSLNSIEELSSKLESMLSRRVCKISAHILYVEDSKTAAMFTMKDLKETNISIDHYFSADEAFAVYKKHHKQYDMVITDVALEGKLDGLGFVRAIREFTPENYKMPILAVSGFDDTSRRVELLRSGANDYIVKPYVKEELVVRLNNLITTKNLFDQVEEQQEQLYQQAMKDHLTGLYNRHAMESFLPKFSSAAIRHNRPLGILFFDIDHFKQVNDQHGHIIGDNVLEKMGKMILSSFRSEDFCARYGGEEFIVLLFNTLYKETLVIAEKFRKKVAAEQFSELDITISIGATCAKITSKSDIYAIIAKTDEALYQAKETGRNKVCSFDLTKVNSNTL